MKYKVLKHKELEDTYGVFHLGDNCEIWQREMPQLFKSDVTMEYLKKTYKNYTASEQLEDYELIAVELKTIN